MEEERYLQIFLTPSELGPNLKAIILIKLNEKYSKKEIQGMMITYIEIKDFNNIPLSRTTPNNIQINAPVQVIFKIY